MKLSAEPMQVGHSCDEAIAAVSAQRKAMLGETPTARIEDEGKVWCDTTPADLKVPVHWLAGTFPAGIGTEPIVDDPRGAARACERLDHPPVRQDRPASEAGSLFIFGRPLWARRTPPKTNRGIR